ncbi:chemotaxis protein CheA [Jannaschia rubra]|uniref:Chemotaxis protein CheA n=2 Tax=Jannaschia rubra TaxID=282197 RepID=A0A0M6XUW3_9RHOB|nr:chemotaxis protein CheA [Jannaschia rubra]CTQ34063.1 Chemotaxis protein CheA [Jannaschia rubra]SFG24005.1 two-component system, chemotaxis family, sensor kinase CheA [Jannaschia rubra]
MDPMDAIRATYFEECAELLEVLEDGLLSLQAGTPDADTIDAVFRAVHSIKGGAAAFNLGLLVGFAHEFETVLDALRNGELKGGSDAFAVLLRASDTLGDLVSAVRDDLPVDAPDTRDLARLLSGGTPSSAGGGFVPVMIDLGQDMNGPVRPDVRRVWTILFEPLPELLGSGNEPLYLFRALEVLGRIEVTAIETDLPTLDRLDPDVPRLRWSVRLTPSAPDLTETEIEAVFEFAVDLCILEVSAMQDGDRPATPIAPFAPDIAERGDVAPPETAAPATVAAPSGPATIRVDLTRVDRLVDLVGELVISQSVLAQGLAQAGLDHRSEAIATLEDLQQLTRDIQDSIMSIRAQPVKPLFQRMTRIVREVSTATGKDIHLVTEGEATEIDKTVVERLTDPLTHMVRNAIDHGIEDPAERVRVGKSAIGVVRLTARQKSDRVVIEVSDDGRGIDRARVLEKAITRGMVEAGSILDPAEIDRLLFKPGLSTVTEISSLSGRGVGMDVVQRAIRDLSGTISVRSETGKGCTISISLPLTLAILDGMIVRASGHHMVLPLSSIVETQSADTARTEMLSAGQEVVLMQDRFVPMLDLGQCMGFPVGSAVGGQDDDEAALLFVQPENGGIYALRVDAIEAQRQVVIKGLSDNFGHIPCVSAATILGNGQVALIVDPAGTARHAGLRPETHEHLATEARAS